MKDVQQQHLLFKTASRMSELFPKTLVSLYLFVRLYFLACLWRLKYIEASRSKTRTDLSLIFTGNYYNWVFSNIVLFPFATRKLI